MKKLAFALIATMFLVPVVLAVPNGFLARYYVKSKSPILKSTLGVRHEFPEGFTSTLTPNQLKALDFLGVETEEVPLYHVTVKPFCNNNGVCEPELGENPSCADCKNGDDEEPPADRSCYPSAEPTWGIVMVNGGSGGAGVDVAILDTGVYRDHLDLTRRIVDCQDFTKGPKVRKGCADSVGHGTHVAGTVAADGGTDGLGIFGVAPEAGIMAYKVCSDSGCWTDDIAAAIDYAANNGAEIISMSFGGSSPSSLIKDAIDKNPDVLYIASAGNNGPDEDSMGYPGAFKEVMGIAAIKEDEEVASFSSRGLSNGDDIVDDRELDLAAPGVLVESTFNDGCYYVASGTSMSAPHVSGLAAKLWQGSASETRDYLDSFDIAKDLYTEGHDIYTGFGLPITPLEVA